MSRRRVFITGLGMVTPHGSDPHHVFSRVYAGESAVRDVELDEPVSGVPDSVPLAPAHLDGKGIISKAQRIFMARASELAVVAAHGALGTAGLLEDGLGPGEAGVYVGCGLGGSEALQKAYRTHYLKGRRVRPTTVPLTMANGPTSHISMQYALRGPTVSYSIACASSAVALGEAFRAIRDGYQDVIVSGGTEAMLNGVTVSAWHLLGVLARPHPEGVETSSRPFDAQRTGIVLGEGAVMFVLESEERVQRRGVVPLGEIVGYGMGSDAHNLTDPHKDGQIQAFTAALRDARLDPEAIGYINAHATATPIGDLVEIEAIKEAFGDHAENLPISSTKAVHGHLVGAAGAIEAAITCMALDKRMIPPTAHLTDPDPALDLDCVPCIGRAVDDLEYGLSNSFAFGGTNAALIFRRV
ncbi:MAG: beta-ketoacyl-[acyl-carrier-protein] synthase family protein [Longimicrobiales bacterium]